MKLVIVGVDGVPTPQAPPGLINTGQIGAILAVDNQGGVRRITKDQAQEYLDTGNISFDDVVINGDLLVKGVLTLEQNPGFNPTRIEHHYQLPIAAALTTGSTEDSYGAVAAGKIANSNSDIFYVSVEVPTAWDGTDNYLEVDWVPKTDILDTETVIWKFEWKCCAAGQDIDHGSSATATVTYTSSGVTSAGTIIHSPCTVAYNNANQPITEEDHIYFKIYRDFTADTYGGIVLITAFEHVYFADALSQV